jgi:hypothetical protein
MVNRSIGLTTIIFVVCAASNGRSSPPLWQPMPYHSKQQQKTAVALNQNHPIHQNQNTLSKLGIDIFLYRNIIYPYGTHTNYP